jgi:hypothetical protein
MMKFTRLGLFEKLARGELNEGDRFISNKGDIVRVSKTASGKPLIEWDATGITLSLVHNEDEWFEPYEEKKTVELTRKEINTLFILACKVTDKQIEEWKCEQPRTFGVFDTVSTWDIYRKLINLVEENPNRKNPCEEF